MGFRHQLKSRQFHPLAEGGRDWIIGGIVGCDVPPVPAIRICSWHDFENQLRLAACHGMADHDMGFGYQVRLECRVHIPLHVKPECRVNIRPVRIVSQGVTGDLN